MPISYPEILELRDQTRRFSWDEQDVMLYALGIGCGADRRHDELKYVQERGLEVIPTFASVVCWGAGVSPDQMGLNRRQTVHASETVILHRPLPATGSLISNARVTTVWDKGKKGAVVDREIKLTDADTGAPLATIQRTALARADGGFGGPAHAPVLPAIPSHAADRVMRFVTRPEQALLYRLCGDRNPLHAEPAIAAMAGFPRPILHGLCTLGICCRAVLTAYNEEGFGRLTRFGGRFSGPVFPGEEIEVLLWRSDNEVAFKAWVPARDALVISHGQAVFAESDVDEGIL